MENDKKTRMFNILSVNKTKTKILIITLIIPTILLSLSFYKNNFAIADMDTFINWQNDSEALVLGRLIKSRQSGLQSTYGFLQRDPNWYEDNKFITGEHTDTSLIYLSQIGLQGLAFGIIDKYISLNNNDTLKLLYFINSLFLAILIVLVAFWANNQFNLLSGLFVIIGCMLSPWLVFSAKNLYWVLWTMLLPFTTILYLQWLEQKIGRINQLFFSLAAFFTVFIRTACGFEFISSILISIEIPVIFYAIGEKWNSKRYLYRSLFIGVGGLLAFIATFCINMWQKVMYFGDFNAALEEMKYNISKRTGAFNVELAPDYQNSLEQPLLKIVDTYLRGGSSLVLDYRMAELILFLIILTSCLLISPKYTPSIEEKRNKLAPLAIVTYISLLAPFSWMILAKGHSVIHPHINYILWYFPSILLIFAFSGATIQLILKDIWNKQHNNCIKRCLIVISVILISIWPICRYYPIRDWNQNIRQVKQIQNDGITLYRNKSLEMIYYKNTLFYKVNKKNDITRRFFLHIIPVNLNMLSQEGIKQGFDNRDFAFERFVIKLPFWKTYYVVKVDLPDYEIERINSGQFRGSTRFWETSVALSEVY